MKKTILLFGALVFLLNSSHGQKQGGGGAEIIEGLLTADAAVSEYQLWLEEVELLAFQQILETRNEEKACRVKLLTADAKKITDNSSTQAMVFAVTFFNPDTQEVIKTEVLLMMPYPGYVAYTGIEYSKVSWMWFDQNSWTDMKRSFVDIASPAELDGNNVKLYEEINSSDYHGLPTQLELKKGLVEENALYYEETGEVVSLNSLSIDMTGFSVIGQGVRGKVPAYRLRNDDYIYAIYNEDLSLIAHENALGLYLRRLGRVIQISRADVRLMESFLFNWGERAVEQQISSEFFVDDQPLVPLCWQQEMKKGDIGYLLSETDLGDINIRGKYVPTGDAELYQEAVKNFGKFTITEILTFATDNYSIDDEIYYENDKVWLKGRIIDAQLDTSSPFIEIEYLDQGKLKSKKVAPSNSSIRKLVNSSACPDAEFIEITLENDFVLLVDPSTSPLFRVR